MFKTARTFIAAIALVPILAGCGGGGSSAPPVTVTPTPSPTPTPTADKWAAVKAEVDGFSVSNVALIVGNASGVRLRYERGAFKLTDTHLVASASKMMAGLTILKMIEDGQMSLGDNPQKYLPYWTTSAADPRSRITLAQLLAFTSGFNASDTPSGCISNAATTLQACAQDYYTQGITSTPGANFFYSNGHLEIAGAMAEVAGSKSFSQLYRDKVAVPLGLGPVSGINFPSAANPRIAGGGSSTGDEYAKMLDGVLTGRLLNAASVATFQTDQTATAAFSFRPSATTQLGDWHYTTASWRECDFSPYDSRCATGKGIISSPGAFGWTPWIDFDNGYYGLIAMEEGAANAANISVQLEQRLQPMIVAALAAGG